jgi:hypothetical protein
MIYYEINLVRNGQPIAVSTFTDEETAIEWLASLEEVLNIHLTNHSGVTITAELYEQDFVREGVPLQRAHLLGLPARY